MTAFDQAFALLKANRFGFLCTNCQMPLISIGEAKRSGGTLGSDARSMGPIDELGFCPSCGGFVNPSEARSINASSYAGPYENLEAAIDAWQKEQLSRSYGAKLGREVSRLAHADRMKRLELGLEDIHQTTDDDFDEEGRYTDEWRKRYRKERKDHRDMMRYRALQNRLNEEKVEEDEEEPVEDFSIYDNLDYDIWRRD